MTAAREAGVVVLRHYARGNLAVKLKEDQSPVTDADREADALIVSRLRAAFPNDAILTEESPDDGARLSARRLWIIDPLDGTRDFISRTGDFCVHIALAIDGVPMVGVVYHPLSSRLYATAPGAGAFVEDEGGERTTLHTSTVANTASLRVGVSRANATYSLKEMLAATGLGARVRIMGASVKLMALAAGELDAVINLTGLEGEWDTCAPEAIIRAAGGLFTDVDGRALLYNQAETVHRGSIASNGYCHTAVLELVRPYIPAAAPPTSDDDPPAGSPA